MNQYVTGAIIKELREKYHLTQAEFAEKINVSDSNLNSTVPPFFNFIKFSTIVLSSEDTA